MKQLLLSVFLLFSVSIKAQNVNIPDANFKNALLSHNPVIDTNSDGEISIFEAEGFRGEIYVSRKNISDLTGIEAFVNLTYLNCAINNLTSLDISKNTALQRLWCSHNQLTSLDVSNNIVLEWLICYRNQIKSLDVINNTALNSLHCGDNPLSSLDVSHNISLEILYCNNNQLTSLDVSSNTALKHLFCEDNQLTSLDVNNNALQRVWCFDNQLTSLDVSNSALVWLRCQNNKLTSLDISNGNNSNLRMLNFIDNPDLSCVTVDNPTQSRNWQKQQEVANIPYETNITYTFDWDDHVVFSEDCSALSIQDITNNTFEVYPNPANNFITIDSTLGGNYNLVSIFGKRVAEGALRQGDNTIDLSNFKTGIYLLNIHSNNNSKTLKIVKE